MTDLLCNGKVEDSPVHVGHAPLPQPPHAAGCVDTHQRLVDTVHPAHTNDQVLVSCIHATIVKTNIVDGTRPSMRLQ